MVKLSVCFIKHIIMKIYGRLEVWLHSFSTMGLDEGKRSASCPIHFTLEGSVAEQELGGSQRWSGCGGERIIPFPPWNQTPVIQPTAMSLQWLSYLRIKTLPGTIDHSTHSEQLNQVGLLRESAKVKRWICSFLQLIVPIMLAVIYAMLFHVFFSLSHWLWVKKKRFLLLRCFHTNKLSLNYMNVIYDLKINLNQSFSPSAVIET
jgi:hypothetical protein